MIFVWGVHYELRGSPTVLRETGVERTGRLTS